MNRVKLFFSIIVIGSNYLLFSQQQIVEPFKLSKAKITATPKEGVQYVFNSPDGNNFYYSSQDLNKVFIQRVGGKKASGQLVFEGTNAGYFPQWSHDGKQLYLRSKNKKESVQRIQSWVYSVENNLVTERNLPFSNPVNTAVVLNNTNGDYLYINSKLMLEVYNEQANKTTVLEGTESCYQIILSPLGDKVVVHIGPNIWVYSLNDQTQPINLGVGLVSSWSPDGKYLLGFKEEQNDGHQIRNTDIYAFDVKSQKSIQLTFTKKTQEMNPSWSFDGKAIYYITLETGSIYFSKLKFK